MSLKTDFREEKEEWIKSGKSIESYYEYIENQLQNPIKSNLKEVVYSGVSLTIGDILLTNGEQHIIDDFTEAGTPILSLISSSIHDSFGKEMEESTEFTVIKNNKQIQI